MPIDPVRSGPTALDACYQAIVSAIIDARLPPGALLTQERLADELGVSRQPVLIAIALLRRDGLLLDTANGRGMRVAPLDALSLRHLYQLRTGLDATAARAAASRPRPELRAEALQLLEQGQQSISERNPILMARAGQALHRFIYQCSENPALVGSAAAAALHCCRATAQIERPIGEIRQAWKQHTLIVNAILRGEAGQAASLSRRHAAHARQSLLRAFRIRAA